MNEQFSTYKIAKKLKELGFNGPCIGWFDIEGNFFFVNNPQKPINKQDLYYYQDCLAPLWQQVIDWLLTKKIFVRPSYGVASVYYTVYEINTDGKKRLFSKETKTEAILQALELI